MLKLAAAVTFVILSAVAGFAANVYFSAPKTTAANKTSTEQPSVPWVAAATGRVEPASGEIRIGATVLGRVMELLVKENDLVETGQMMVRLDDDEARARLAAAEAEVAARKSDRDSKPPTVGREDLRKAEDAFYAAERTVTAARFELDATLATRRPANVTPQQTLDSRRRLTEARDRLDKERAAYIAAQGRTTVAPNGFEAALTAARAQVALAESALERTRVRASVNGTVLQVIPKLGEVVTPGAEPLVVIGDMSTIRVTAEFDEGDAAKLRLGQRAFVRSPSHPGREFEGKINWIAPSLTAQKLGARGPRRPSDVDVLEVKIEIDGKSTLLPGIRVEAYVRRD